MKKIIAAVLSVLFCGTLFTSFSPSLDGRAVVADEGVLPSGIFARTLGYLPGDSISVTSLSTKKTVDILVIGAVDASEGIAILLSPEAAKELGLPKNSNNVVKITKRSGQLDEAVAGTAVIGAEIADVDSYDSESDGEVENIPASYEEPEEEAGAAEPTVPAEEAEEEASVPSDEESAILPEDEVEPVPAEDEDEEPELEAESVQPEPITLIDGEKTEEVSANEEEAEPASDEAVEEDTIAETPFVEEETAEAVQSDFDNPSVVDDDAVIEPEYVEADDLSEADENAEKISDPFIEDEDVDSDLGKEETEKTEEDDVIADSYVEPEVPSDETENAEGDASETAEADGAEPTEDGEESYEPIILVPAKANPPVTDEEVALDNASASETSAARESVTQETNEAPKPSNGVAEELDLSEYIVSSLSDLKKGAFYVQIAVLGNEANVRATIKKFNRQYPIVLVPTANGKGYQFLIGALNMDEYGTVLNRFRSYGYKDAFLRKIK